MQKGILSVRAVVNCRRTNYDVYIGRGSIWGNDFRIGKDGTRAEVIQKYEKRVRSQPELLRRLPELHNKVLGCFCKPKECHGDILVKLVAEYPACLEESSVTGVGDDPLTEVPST